MYYQCNIKFKDTEEEFTSIVKDSCDIVEAEDDNIFFYCNGKHEIEALMSEDNGEDFIIIEMSEPFSNINELL